jgi:predicted RNase H-like nuclease (RuvC/YqgF family)
VTNQATRICSYERKIEQLDTDNQRLRIQQQLSTRNKLSVTQQQEIEDMKVQSNHQQEDIERLKMALDMIRVNQHYDNFGGLAGT